MRFLNCPLFSTLSATQNQTSGIIECSLIFQASVQISTLGNAAGSAQLQVSNDIPPAGDLGPFTPTNWANLGSAVTFSGVSVNMIPKTDISYRWLRLALTSTSPPVQEIDTVHDVASSLNNTYFLISDANSAHKYMIWFNVSGQGVAPTPPTGYVAEEVDISTGATASAVATALAAVLNGLTGFTSAVIATNRVRLSNAAVGPFIPAADGAVPTGFTFSVTTAGTILANLKTLGD